MIVYKYMKIEHVILGIENGIFASRLDRFNDPYEYKGIRYLDDYRVCCLTKSPRQMLMWAYYVGHRGCCVAYEIPNNVPNVRDVNYSKEYYNHRDMNQHELSDSLYSKAYEWQHEKEIRIIYHKDEYQNDVLWKEYKGEVYFRAVVKKVFFGLETDLAEETCQELLKYIQVINEKEEVIEVKQCRLSDVQYRIEWDKQFDYKKEINNG